MRPHHTPPSSCCCCRCAADGAAAGAGAAACSLTDCKPLPQPCFCSWQLPRLFLPVTHLVQGSCR
jgi:hypothetical protein